jgi:hypothetical protein
LWPLIAVLSLLCVVGVFMGSSSDSINRLGSVTVWSVGIFLATLLYVAACIACLLALWRARKTEIRRLVRWHSTAVIAALTIVALYLAYWGVIGIRTWS